MEYQMGSQRTHHSVEVLAERRSPLQIDAGGLK